MGGYPPGFGLRYRTSASRGKPFEMFFDLRPTRAYLPGTGRDRGEIHCQGVRPLRYRHQPSGSCHGLSRRQI
jgi:hypothetical protein